MQEGLFYLETGLSDNQFLSFIDPRGFPLPISGSKAWATAPRKLFGLSDPRPVIHWIDR